MKPILFFLLLALLSSRTIVAQDSLVAIPGFRMMRAQEDYGFLRDRLAEAPGWARMKYLPLGEDAYLSIGGDIRSAFQVLRNEGWRKGNNDAAFFQRFMLHTDWHFGKHLRIFSQWKSAHSLGRNGAPFFLDDDDLDFHQLFVGIEMGNATLEIGRRELSYGARRLISIREGTNVRQSFDGARLILRQPSFRLDILLYAYNPQQVGAFDNEINTDQLLWGGYLVWDVPKTKGLHFDFYYLGVANEAPLFEEGTAREVRHSLGVRHWGKQGRFSFNNEAVFQFGNFGDGNIIAWTLSTETKFQLNGTKLPTTLGLKAEIISGDRLAGDGDLQTFNGLYPRGGYFGLLALIGPANLVDIHPSVAFSIGKKFLLNLDWDVFWRHRATDGIYLPSGRLNLLSSGSTARFIGHQPGIQLATTVNRFLELEVSYFYFIPGTYIKEITDGAGFSQLGFSAGYRF